MSTNLPQVPYHFPGEPFPQWIDIYNGLYGERIIFLNKEFNDEIANQSFPETRW
jgi:ATP-dependent Clp protease protease subunit